MADESHLTRHPSGGACTFIVPPFVGTSIEEFLQKQFTANNETCRTPLVVGRVEGALLRDLVSAEHPFRSRLRGSMEHVRDVDLRVQDLLRAISAGLPALMSGGPQQAARKESQRIGESLLKHLPPLMDACARVLPPPPPGVTTATYPAPAAAPAVAAVRETLRGFSPELARGLAATRAGASGAEGARIALGIRLGLVAGDLQASLCALREDLGLVRPNELVSFSLPDGLCERCVRRLASTAGTKGFGSPTGRGAIDLDALHRSSSLSPPMRNGVTPVRSSLVSQDVPALVSTVRPSHEVTSPRVRPITPRMAFIDLEGLDRSKRRASHPSSFLDAVGYKDMNRPVPPERILQTGASARNKQPDSNGNVGGVNRPFPWVPRASTTFGDYSTLSNRDRAPQAPSILAEHDGERERLDLTRSNGVSDKAQLVGGPRDDDVSRRPHTPMRTRLSTPGPDRASSSAVQNISNRGHLGPSAQTLSPAYAFERELPPALGPGRNHAFGPDRPRTPTFERSRTPSQHPARPHTPSQHPARPHIPSQHPARPHTPSQHPARPHTPSQHPARPHTPSQHPARPHTPSQHPARPHTPSQHPARPHTPSQHPARPHTPSQHPARPRTPRQHPARPRTPSQARPSTPSQARPRTPGFERPRTPSQPQSWNAKRPRTPGQPWPRSPHGSYEPSALGTGLFKQADPAIVGELERDTFPRWKKQQGKDVVQLASPPARPFDSEIPPEIRQHDSHRDLPGISGPPEVSFGHRARAHEESRSQPLGYPIENLKSPRPDFGNQDRVSDGSRAPRGNGGPSGTGGAAHRDLRERLTSGNHHLNDAVGSASRGVYIRRDFIGGRRNDGARASEHIGHYKDAREILEHRALERLKGVRPGLTNGFERQDGSRTFDKSEYGQEGRQTVTIDAPNGRGTIASQSYMNSRRSSEPDRDRRDLARPSFDLEVPGAQRGPWSRDYDGTENLPLAADNRSPGPPPRSRIPREVDYERRPVKSDEPPSRARQQDTIDDGRAAMIGVHATSDRIPSRTISSPQRDAAVPNRKLGDVVARDDDLLFGKYQNRVSRPFVARISPRGNDERYQSQPRRPRPLDGDRRRLEYSPRELRPDAWEDFPERDRVSKRARLLNELAGRNVERDDFY
jgi:hypothetical protein